MTTLTLDLGTSATKAAVWDGATLVALTRAAIETTHPASGSAEQDPSTWWTSVVDACAELRDDAPDAFGAVDAVGFAAARETFALFDADLQPLGSGILWSDRRAGERVAALGDPAAFRARTGVLPTAGCCAAKVRWVMEHDAAAFTSARWLLAPRDVVFARLTDRVVTDRTLASRTGLYDLDGGLLDDSLAACLPEVVAPVDAVPASAGAEELGLARDTPVVLGAGDRACEVLGVGASEDAPMVSWGTTANVSVPHPGPVDALPTIAQVSRGALGGFVIEAGLSAAGAALAWLSRLTGRTHDALLAEAAGVPPGADGLFALPWLAGARAPWWKPDAHAAFVGLTEAHGAAEMARAIVEGVAFDVARCLDLVESAASELSLAGGGAADALWRQIVAAVTGRPVVRRAIDDAASVGARLLVAEALGEPLEVDDVNGIVVREEPSRALARAYDAGRDAADAVASAVISASELRGWDSNPQQFG